LTERDAGLYKRSMSRSRRWLPASAALLAAWLFPALAAAQQAQAARAEPGSSAEIALWPGVAPGSEGLALEEQITERSQDPAVPDRIRTAISRPRLIQFRARRASGVGVIIAPGGGYVREVLDKEGFETARWLAARGVDAFVLVYRLPSEGHQRAADVPLQDAQRAVRLLRGSAKALGLDARRIGFLGFSAGGHLAASVSTRFDAKVYAPVDALDRESARPDFSILLYPVIDMEAAAAHAGSRRALLGEAPSPAAIASYSAQNGVTAATPPTLLVLASDDAAVLPANSLRYYEALQRNGVAAELHIFAQGKHGFGIRGAKGLPAGNWPELAWGWLRASGFLPAAVRGAQLDRAADFEPRDRIAGAEHP
jgi:acetyl esterase/lipase